MPMSRDPEEMYTYQVPDGYGDTFFAYVFDGGTSYNNGALTNGNSYQGLLVPVLDGDFVNRFVTGFETLSPTGGFQLYDSLLRQCFSDYVKMGTFAPSGLVVLPERVFPVTNNLRFDVQNVLLATNGVSHGHSIIAAQLVFYGVRRRALHYSDPEPSKYTYYEKQYEVGQENSTTATYRLSINQAAYNANGALNAPQVEKILIRDFDFELRRVELALNSPQQLSQFKITLYDNYGNATSNLPILSNKFFHLDPRSSSGELNFQPAVPILYKVGSYLKFDIWSLLPDTSEFPVEFDLLFHGVRRIPCN